MWRAAAALAAALLLMACDGASSGSHDDHNPAGGSSGELVPVLVALAAVARQYVVALGSTAVAAMLLQRRWAYSHCVLTWYLMAAKACCALRHGSVTGCRQGTGHPCFHCLDGPVMVCRGSARCRGGRRQGPRRRRTGAAGRTATVGAGLRQGQPVHVLPAGQPVRPQVGEGGAA